MSRRTYDDRPVPGDTGYVERPRAQLSALGQRICHQVLDHFNAAYALNFDNDTITVESGRDFFRTLDVLARSMGTDSLTLQLTRAEGEAGAELVFPIRSGSDVIRLRMADEQAEVALATVGLRISGKTAVYRADSFEARAQIFLRALAARDPDLASD